MTTILAPDVPVTGTVLPVKDPDVVPTPRTSVGQIPAESRFLNWGALVAALGMAWVIAERLLPLHGLPWFLAVFAVCNLGILAVGTATMDNATAVVDRVMRWVVSTATLVVIVALCSVMVYVLGRGWPALRHASFFLHDMSGISQDAPLSQGGILHAIVGSLIELGIASAIALPLGVGTAVFMNEIGGRFSRVVRTVVEAMTALPDILAGLFIYTVWIVAFHQPSSGFAAALALTVMMLPIIARASDVVLRVVPASLREASLALGSSRWSTVWHVVLPTARPGLATALILAVARGIGETAPVLLTSGNANFMVKNPFGGPMTSLPLYIFESYGSGIPLQIQRAFGAASVLLVLVLILFVAARVIARAPSNKAPLWKRILRHHPPASNEDVP